MWGGNKGDHTSKFTYTKTVFSTTSTNPTNNNNTNINNSNTNTNINNNNNINNNVNTNDNNTNNNDTSDGTPTSKLFTCGYGGCKAFPEFLSLLKKSDISLLVDIRIRPNCSFCKDFNGPRLDELLKQHNIHYEHFSELGNVFKDVDNSGVLYQELVDTAGELLTRRLRSRVATHRHVSIMCACGKPDDCHRKKVSTFLQKEFGHEIHHI